MIFSDKDLQVLKSKDIPVEKANWQIEQFKKGIAPAKLNKSAIPGSGIVIIENVDQYIKAYDSAQVEVVKFTPASGAASRMFKALFEFKDTVKAHPEINLSDYPDIEKFFSNLKKFAFYGALDKILEGQGGIERVLASKNYFLVLDMLLGENGLAYGILPKGLLAFHFYAGGISRTPFEEHMVEGAKYAQSTKNKVNLHYTVSPEHLPEFEKLKDKIIPKYQDMYSVTYNIDFSIQKSSTDTLAVTPENTPFYDENGNILFRPGGHGALIENLNEINADIIFIKNIDNVVPEKRMANTVKYKKAIAGYLLDVQAKVFSLIKNLKESPTEKLIQEAKQLLTGTFFLSDNCFDGDNIEKLISALNRPIRICGMVKSEGDPGGGPFMTEDENGCISPQIVETSQIDLDNPSQKEIFNTATHFNPVDLICAVRDYAGNKFDLKEYIDHNACFISKKSKNGKDLKALELPGLWNGAMAKWNTIFVEVPIDTFNPVKTVNDLLRDAHQ